MWRYDAQRSAASPDGLPEKLHLQWTLKLPALEPAWDEPVNQDRMPYDRAYEPIVQGELLFFGSNRSDRVTAVDVTDGTERWRYYSNGPVRFPPVCADGKLLFVSDDSRLTCLGAKDGSLLWRRRGGPSARKVLGNGRLISTWPARGGPVVADGRVYWAAGIWPFEGCYLSCLDIDDGKPVWENSGFSYQFQRQPHGGSYSFAGIAPQGALAVLGDRLIVPGGRSVPACFDRNTGALRFFHFEGSPSVSGVKVHNKLEGGSQLAAWGDFYLNHRGVNTVLYSAKTGHAHQIWNRTTYPVLDDGMLYLSGETLEAYRLDDLREKPAKAKPVWQLKADTSAALIKAGNRFYAAGKKEVVALELQPEGPPTIAWKLPVEGNVTRLIAAADRLFAVTIEGDILAFGAEESAATVHVDPAAKLQEWPVPGRIAKKLLDKAALDTGYCLVLAPTDAQIAKKLVADSRLKGIVVEADEGHAAELRRWLDDAGLYGERLSVLHGTPSALELPPYFTALAVCEQPPKWADFTGEITAIYRSLRPYGGTLCIPIAQNSKPEPIVDAVKSLDLPRAEVSAEDGWVFLSRRGPLEGAGTWTHQYGDIANTVKSNDKRVRLPLGLLWFGGNTHMDVLPRHGHGPPEQVLGGRLFIEGVDLFSARDVYTGTTLWKRKFPDLGTDGVYYNSTYRPDPLDLTYNQAHIPGANVRGTNFVATPEAIYLVMQDRCELLDPADGRTLRTFYLPRHNKGENEPAPTWGFVGVYQDILLAGSSGATFSKQFGVKKSTWEDFDHASSKRLVAMNRYDGTVLWTREAKHAFRHNTIIAGSGKVFCVDRLPKPILDKLKRRGEKIDAKPVVRAFDAATGKIAWENSDAAFGTFLSYSKKHDCVVQGGRASRDMAAGEPFTRLNTLRASDGSVLWDKNVTYGGPCIIHGDTLYTNAIRADGGALSLATGEPIRTKHPLTGAPVSWTYHRTYGCNTVIAAENLLTFRSGAAGFCDLRTGGTGNFGGFKSGCTSNLIAADGVLNAPDYTRTCTCPYQNQTSLAMVPREETDYWLFHQIPLYPDEPCPIRRLGLNFGAPGDHADGQGVLWLDYPSVGGPSPNPEVAVEGDVRYVRRNSRAVVADSDSPRWIAASYAEGMNSITISLVPEEDAVEVPVAASEDDAEEDASRKVDVDSSDLELTQDGSEQIVGIRFRNLRLDAAARIRAAWIQFTVDESTTEKTTLKIAAEASDDPSPFAAKDGNISARPKTSASIAWNPQAWTEVSQAGGLQRSPDVTPLLKEILSRPGWKKGNAAAFLITGIGKRTAKAFDGDAKASPRLYVKYEPDRDWPETLSYTVELHFIEPNPDAKPGDRRFDVSIQGKKVLQNFDIVKEAKRPNRGIIRRFEAVPVKGNLRIEFHPISGSPIVSGISTVQE